MVQFSCPLCQAAVEHPTPGAKLPCPACGQRLQVPGPPTAKTLLGTWPPAPVPVPPPRPAGVACPGCGAPLPLAADWDGGWVQCRACALLIPGTALGVAPRPPPLPSPPLARRAPLSPFACYDCGRRIPVGKVCRRMIQTGHSGGRRVSAWVSGSSTSDRDASGLGRGGHWTSGHSVTGGTSGEDHYTEVPLCPACALDRDREEHRALVARRVGCLLGFLVCLVLLPAAALGLLALLEPPEGYPGRWWLWWWEE